MTLIAGKQTLYPAFTGDPVKQHKVVQNLVRDSDTGVIDNKGATPGDPAG